MLTRAQWEKFKEDRFHTELQKEFKSWLRDVHIELEDMTGKCTDKELHRLAGNAQTIRNAINVVSIIIERLKMDEEAENGKR